ncbi:MAG: xanthine dehydrogenase family protein molybdopterin-binding subunit [Chloroflexi bacterium]|nr:xanthine dehydrogenase family protein molybdopterin-binding subunit [Chloroflexota bacterium]MCL5076137.1 xanthine dehydrogenase family protein molybdopterin-binding subunit [Chloroflexota bacterium]
MEGAVIGQSVPRLDSPAKAIGKADFTADLRFQGMLQAKILGSKHAHARISHIDTTLAERLPGVQAVITAKDAPAVRYGVYLKDEVLLAREKVCYLEEPVAAVAAVDEDCASEALALIRVEYEPLPAVFDPLEAMQPDAALIHQDSSSYKAVFPSVRYGNVCMYTRIEHGNVEEGLAAADLIVEDTFCTQPVHQCYLEPHAVVALFDASGKLTVWSSTQQVFVSQATLAEVLQIPMTKVRVINTYLGGGFGGKLNPWLEGIAALLARKSARPVKLVFNRLEEFMATQPRAPFIIELKTGVKRDGRIVVRVAKIIGDAGAYADHALGETAQAAVRVQGPYKIPHMRAEGFCVYTNKVNFGCYRGYGVPQAVFAAESQMDIIAERLGLDPLAFRAINLAEDGDLLPSGERLRCVSIKETMQTAAERADWMEKRVNKVAGRGIGIGNAYTNTGMLASSVFLRSNEDGTFQIFSGVVDIGTGANTILCQIAAEELGVPLEDVSIVSGDTDMAPYDLGSIATRVTYDTGNAVRLAAMDVKRQLFEIAAKRLEANIEDLEIGHRHIYVKGSPDKGVTVAEICQHGLYVEGGPIVGRGKFLGVPSFKTQPGEGYPLDPYPSFIFGTHIAEVEVDKDTGQVKVLRIVAVHDLGRAINPLAAMAQIEGGIGQGLGYVLTERMIFNEEGRVLNPTLLDYKVPTALDMPQMEVVILEYPDELAPFGAKGIGELPQICAPAAVANAVADAIGVRIRELPLTAEKILEALRQDSV